MADRRPMTIELSYDEWLKRQQKVLEDSRSYPAKAGGECCGETWRSEKAFAAHQRYHDVWGELERERD